LLPKSGNNVEATFNFVDATFDFVERIVRLVAFDNERRFDVVADVDVA